MEIITGQPVFPAVALGTLRICPPPARQYDQHSRLSPGEEAQRFHWAKSQTLHQLEQMRCRAAERAGEIGAEIFAVYAMLVEDREYQNLVCSCIFDQGTTAEYAIFLAGERFAADFSAMDDDYMSAREADMRNVSRHLMDNLTGYVRPEPRWAGPVILVDETFSPQRTLTLDRKLLVGMVARRGNVHSHAAQLTRAMEIPSMVRTWVPLELDGHPAALDSAKGRLYIDPAPEVLARLAQRLEPARCGAF